MRVIEYSSYHVVKQCKDNCPRDIYTLRYPSGRREVFLFGSYGLTKRLKCGIYKALSGGQRAQHQ